MAKAIIQRALPLTDTYKVHSFSYVSLIDGQGTCCENCGKLISNMVTLENQKGEKFVVGNDCADTLTIDKSKMFFEVQPAFSEGKSLRAKIMKHFKNKTIVKAYIYNGNDKKQFVVLKTSKGASSMQQIMHPKITLPYIKDLLTDKT
jgi:hypothetical protein